VEEYRHPDSFAWVDITRRETIEAAEKAINKTIEHYNKKLSFINGPKVVKTFTEE
jgi:rubrerythrin